MIFCSRSVRSAHGRLSQRRRYGAWLSPGQTASPTGAAVAPVDYEKDRNQEREDSYHHPAPTSGKTLRGHHPFRKKKTGIEKNYCESKPYEDAHGLRPTYLVHILNSEVQT